MARKHRSEDNSSMNPVAAIIALVALYSLVMVVNLFNWINQHPYRTIGGVFAAVVVLYFLYWKFPAQFGVLANLVKKIYHLIFGRDSKSESDQLQDNRGVSARTFAPSQVKADRFTQNNYYGSDKPLEEK